MVQIFTSVLILSGCHRKYATGLTPIVNLFYHPSPLLCCLSVLFLLRFHVQIQHQSPAVRVTGNMLNNHPFLGTTTQHNVTTSWVVIDLSIFCHLNRLAGAGCGLAVSAIKLDKTVPCALSGWIRENQQL